MTKRAHAEPEGERWLLLIHQIPPHPAYLRVKIGRRLARIGAVAMKNTVYVLPRSDAALEDLQWVKREIVEGEGDASIVAARLVDGLTDAEVEALFRAARDADYAVVANEARAAERAPPKRLDDDRRRAVESLATRLERQIGDIAAIDFFAASGREIAASLVASLRRRAAADLAPAAPRPAETVDSYRGRVWVTRAGVHVDRIASAWLVRRFVDAKARFKFVPPKGYVPARGEVRFDMFEAEFSHEGNLCTFEVLCRRLSLREPGLVAVAELVHDIDVKDARYERAETPGVAAMIAGLALRERDDEERLAHGFALFDSLIAYYARKKEG